ncbi:MAG: TIR domain-containing protein [Candidatus Binatia bacterium]
MREGTVVTFYSYKGGVGRTLALANIGALLCRWGYKVLCVDWDLEAPGLHLYFKSWMETQEKPGLTELIQAHIDGQTSDWHRHLTKVSFPAALHPLSLMTAGVQEASYVQRMQALDWKRLYEEYDLGNFLENLRNQWKETFDFILIDSRTGITDAGGICTVQLPDLLVLLFTANDQSLYGALDVVNRAKHTRNVLPFDRTKLLVLPVAMRFEGRIEYELAQQWLGRFAEALAPLYAEWAHKDVSAQELLNHTRVPYIPYWSFGEKLPVIEKGTDDPEDIGFALETLAALVAQRFAYSDVLVRNRDAFVATVKGKGVIVSATLAVGGAEAVDAVVSTETSFPKKPKVRLFISYSHTDHELLEELEKHLIILKRQGIIEAWHDRLIASGESWTETISAHLEESDVILLLVSADFVASDYCYSIEMRRALEKHAVREALVLPIILRPVDWHGSPFGILQALPQGAKPITTWVNRDEAWVDVVRGVRAAIEEFWKKETNASRLT